jgi:hypothetical protein
VAFAGAIAVLVLLVSLLGGGGGRAAGAPGGGASATPTPTGSDTPPDSPTPTALGGSVSGAPPPVGQSGTGGGDPGTGAGDPTASTTGSTAPAATAAPPGPCRDNALRLTVRTAAAAYRVGDKPVITLTVQNVSATTCTRDLGAAQQEILLYAGTTRLWSSNDCYPGGERDIRALLPQQRATFSVTWSGLSSRPHCAGIRTRVGAGSYKLVGRLGTLRSAAGTLVLR